MLPPMILAMRAPDLWQAGRAERMRILLTSAAFLAAALATAYIIHPYYWENPLRLIEGVRALSQNPNNPVNLFMGELYRSDAVPWNYIPVWFAITSPPATLLLGALGSAAVCRQAIMRPLAALRDREIRFRILLLGCIALPVAVVIALESNLYNGWRHMHFLWAPFCLLAAIGLRSLAGGGAAKEMAGGVAARLPGLVRGCVRLHMARQTLAYGIAGVGLITTLTAMAALHPHQQVLFQRASGHQDARRARQAVRYGLLACGATAIAGVSTRYLPRMTRCASGQETTNGAAILPSSDRERIDFSNKGEVDFYFYQPVDYMPNEPRPPMFHTIQAYGNPIAFTVAPNSDAYLDHYRAAYAAAAANGTPARALGF